MQLIVGREHRRRLRVDHDLVLAADRTELARIDAVEKLVSGGRPSIPVIDHELNLGVLSQARHLTGVGGGRSQRLFG